MPKDKTKIPTVKPAIDDWGKVLEILRVSRGLSKNKLSTITGMPRPQYLNILSGLKDGPTIATVSKLLKGMGCTWDDWGRAFEYVNWGGDWQAKDWETRYEQMLNMPRFWQGFEAAMKTAKGEEAVRRFEAILKSKSRKADREALQNAVQNAVLTVVKEAEAGTLTDWATRASMAAEHTPPYGKKRRRAKT